MMIPCATTVVPADNPAVPFIAALTELVQAQADNPTRFVVLPQWTEILVRHFPPREPGGTHRAVGLNG
ncbi:hypothetical protein ACWC5I_22765 [Kitasatospora sp. NPDC001574]